ncbi:MAG: hypothetical protein ACRDBM_09035, partial [Sporomusa sp.]
MINNRYLYRHYLNTAGVFVEMPGVFGDDYLMNWKIVKNGLYKASVIRIREKIMAEIKTRFERLIAEEMELAKKMLAEYARNTVATTGIVEQKCCTGECS